MQLSDYAQALGAAQQLVQPWDEPERRRAQLQSVLLNNQQQQAALDDRQAEIAQANDFRTALGTLGVRPTADQYRSLATRFPRLFKEISGVADSLDKQHKTAIVSDLTQIGAAIAANQPKLAAARIQRQIDADKAAGQQPDEDDVALLAMLNSGDPEQLKAAGVLVHGSLAALDPDAAKAVSPDQGDHFASTGDNAIYDKRTGTVTREAPPKEPRWQFDSNSGSWIREPESGGTTKGGDPASGGGASTSGGAPTGRTVGGWTPRSRNGGDNNDAAVDAKISGMASALGRSPTAPLDGLSNIEIARALALSEGGPGSLADRNNNPGNLRDPNTGAYRKFPTKEAGLQAAAAQVARNRTRGQNTIQKMVEGLPVGGRVPAPAAGGADVVQVLPGKAKPAKMTPDEVRAEGLDPNIVYYRDANGVPQALSGQSRPTRQALQLNEGQAKATGLLGAMVAAQNALNTVEGYTPSEVALALNDLSNKNPVKANLSQKDRIVLNAQLAFANSILRLESGAAIGGDETANKAQTLFPMPGDGPQVQAAKRKQREAALAAMRAAAGPGSASVAKVTPNVYERQGPQGGKLVGTFQGKPVYQLPNGKRVVAQ